MQDYLVSSIKRVYDDCYRTLDEGSSQNVGRAIINRYNELLGEIQEGYPDYERIQNLDPVNETGAGIAGGSTRPHPNDLQEVKFGVTTIADSAGLDLDDFERVNKGSEMPIIHIHNQQSQSQSQEQSQEQYITTEEIHEEIDRLMTSPEEKERIEERVVRAVTDHLDRYFDGERVTRDALRRLFGCLFSWCELRYDENLCSCRDDRTAEAVVVVFSG